MSEKIPPALSAEDWTIMSADGGTSTEEVTVEIDSAALVVRDWHGDGQRTTQTNQVTVPAQLLPAVIALANIALPDGDPRKLTREGVAAIRKMADDVFDDETSLTAAEVAHTKLVLRMVDALESYLPPKT